MKRDMRRMPLSPIVDTLPSLYTNALPTPVPGLSTNMLKLTHIRACGLVNFRDWTRSYSLEGYRISSHPMTIEAIPLPLRAGNSQILYSAQNGLGLFLGCWQLAVVISGDYTYSDIQTPRNGFRSWFKDTAGLWNADRTRFCKSGHVHCGFGI
jgi:hypothetical protein